MNEQTFHSNLICEQYKKISHSSGLDIYIFPKKLTTFYAIFGVKYGSVHSRFSYADGKNTVTLPDGIAHFLEHKLFAGEDGVDAFEHFAKLGADANAYTSFNKTAYLFSTTENFYESLKELLTFVTHPYFTEENVKNEVGIIAEEIKMYADSPSDRCYYGMLEGMYEHHSIRRNICGSEESINQITPKLLYECHKAFYNLSNMGLFVCGDVDEAEILKTVDSVLPSQKEPFNILFSNENDTEKPQVYKSYIEEKMQVSKPMFNIGIKDTDIPKDAKERQKKDATYSILDEMIFSRAGELYSKLFEQDIISPHLSYGYTATPVAAYNSIAGEADDPKLVLSLILDHIKELKQKGLSYDDFKRGKRVMYAEFVKSFDSTDNIANNLLSFSFEDAELLSYADIIDSVTFEDVNKAFESAFDEEKITLSVILPLDKANN